MSATDEDLVLFNAASYGETTAGVWEMYFDESDVGLSAEDVWGAWIQNDFNAGGVIGDGADIVLFTATTLAAPRVGYSDRACCSMAQPMA